MLTVISEIKIIHTKSFVAVCDEHRIVFEKVLQACHLKINTINISFSGILHFGD